MLSGDHALVARVRESDEADARAAFGTIYENAYDRMVRFAARTVDAETARDIVHDVFTAIWLRRAEWHAPAGSLAYGYTAVRHRVSKQLRHAAVVRRARLQLEPPSPPLRPDRAAEAAELRVAIADAFAAVTARRRAAAVLRLVDGLRYDAVGAALGISDRAAYKLVTAAVRGIRAQLARTAA